MSWSPTYVILIFTSTLIAYFDGILIEKSEPNQRKIIVGLSVALNLAILFSFKYVNFFIENIELLSETLGLT